jgi:hypothetical protein
MELSRQVTKHHYTVSKLENYSTLKIYVSIMIVFRLRNIVALTFVSPGEIHLNGPSSSSSGCVECVRIMFTFPGMMSENTCFPGKKIYSLHYQVSARCKPQIHNQNIVTKACRWSLYTQAMKKNSSSNQLLLFRDRQTAESKPDMMINHSKLILPRRNVTCSEHKTQITKKYI